MKQVFHLPITRKNQLVAYVGMLDKWNKAYNLTSVRDPDEMLVRHPRQHCCRHTLKERVLSMSVRGLGCRGSRWLSCVLNPTSPCWTVWASSTFPSASPASSNWITSPRYKAVEEFPAEPPFDGVISRAFASLNDMVSWCHHLPAENGHFMRSRA